MTATEAPAFEPWDAEKAPRLAPAWRAAMALLVDGGFHEGRELVAAMTAVGEVPIQAKTAANLLWRGSREGWMTRGSRGWRLTTFGRTMAAAVGNCSVDVGAQRGAP